jgi:hypothetical protein
LKELTLAEDERAALASRQTQHLRNDDLVVTRIVRNL